MSELDIVWLGTANAWECDEMGHLNVRYYLAKAEDALAGLLGDLGTSSRTVRRLHVRYHRETRAGTPLLARGGVVACGPTPVVYLEFVSAFDGVVRATLAVTLDGDALPPCRTVALPAHGAPRGLPQTEPRTSVSLAEADAAGLREIYRGLVRREQCDDSFELRPHQVVALISDGVAHLMMQITPHRGLGAASLGIGGAALEQRIIHRAPCRSGDELTIRSGVIDAAGKTMRFCHWLLNRRTGEAVATCEVVAVAFDLTTRKALALPEDVRERIKSMAVSVGA
jgi:acyl-CoA thioester hydrolase